MATARVIRTCFIEKVYIGSRRAARFELAGGSIRACAITAAYLAAEAGRPVRMADLIAAVRREYRKLGRLLLESEFGPYLTAPAIG
jgi:hypothetical protein